MQLGLGLQLPAVYVVGYLLSRRTHDHGLHHACRAVFVFYRRAVGIRHAVASPMLRHKHLSLTSATVIAVIYVAVGIKAVVRGMNLRDGEVEVVFGGTSSDVESRSHPLALQSPWVIVIDLIPLAVEQSGLFADGAAVFDAQRLEAVVLQTQGFAEIIGVVETLRHDLGVCKVNFQRGRY